MRWLLVTSVVCCRGRRRPLRPSAAQPPDPCVLITTIDASTVLGATPPKAKPKTVGATRTCTYTVKKKTMTVQTLAGRDAGRVRQEREGDQGHRRPDARPSAPTPSRPTARRSSSGRTAPQITIDVRRRRSRSSRFSRRSSRRPPAGSEPPTGRREPVWRDARARTTSLRPPKRSPAPIGKVARRGRNVLFSAGQRITVGAWR